MAPSSSMTRMRGFMGSGTGSSRRLAWHVVDANGRQPPFVHARLVDVEGEDVAGPCLGYGLVVVVDRADRPAVDLEDHVAALDVGVERRADGVHAPHDDAAHAVRHVVAD